MKIFLSALETSYTEEILEQLPQELYWNLLSFYYLTGKPDRHIEQIIDRSKQIQIDSGAHSFQKGKTVDWQEYTEQYAKWIEQNDRDKIIGYFEMDIDNRVGFERVKELRGILESVTDKVIPVWHKNRGIKQFKAMCEKYSGKIVAVSGFQNEDIRDSQFKLFLKEAWKHDCKLHGLGLTREKVLDKVPFDYVDSSSWRLQTTFYKIGGKQVDPQEVKKDWPRAMAINYKKAMDKQKHYYKKWKRVNKD